MKTRQINEIANTKRGKDGLNLASSPFLLDVMICFVINSYKNLYMIYAVKSRFCLAKGNFVSALFRGGFNPLRFCFIIVARKRKRFAPF